MQLDNATLASTRMFDRARRRARRKAYRLQNGNGPDHPQNLKRRPPGQFVDMLARGKTQIGREAKTIFHAEAIADWRKADTFVFPPAGSQPSPVFISAYHLNSWLLESH